MEKVRSGESVVIRASTWNAFIDAANYAKEQRQNQLGKGLRSGVGAGIVLVKNAETEQREGRPYAVLLQPLAKDEIGRAMVLGIVPAKVTINDAEDPYAVPTPNSDKGALESSAPGVARILWRAGGSGEQWCLLQLGGAGGGSGGGDRACMCRVTGGSTSAGFTVTVYPNGREDSKTTSNAVLYLPDLALGAEIPEGTWIIGHRCALKATGGSET